MAPVVAVPRGRGGGSVVSVGVSIARLHGVTILGVEGNAEWPPQLPWGAPAPVAGAAGPNPQDGLTAAEPQPLARSVRVAPRSVHARQARPRRSGGLGLVFQLLNVQLRQERPWIELRRAVGCVEHAQGQSIHALG